MNLFPIQNKYNYKKQTLKNPNQQEIASSKKVVAG